MSGKVELLSPFTDSGYRHQLCSHRTSFFADNCVACLRRMYSELHLAAGKLREFKAFVHRHLDVNGVPADPDPIANAQHGCRIEGRLNHVLAQRDEARATAEIHAVALANAKAWAAEAEKEMATLRARVVSVAELRDVSERALAAAQAREVALREAVASLDPCGGYNNHQWVNGEPCRTCGWTLEAAAKLCDALDSPSSATPLSDMSALRAFGLKVAERIAIRWSAGMSREQVVDAVLGGAP